MKKLFTVLFVSFFVLSFYGVASAQLLDENFDYTAGTNLTDNGWTAHSGAGTNPVTVNNGGLTYTGYVNSGIGNAALIDNTGEDVNKAFTAQTSGILYFSFLVNVANIADGYFLHLTDGGFGYAARVFIQNSSGNLQFGISNSSTATFATTPTDFADSTTYLCIVKYDIGTSDCSLWVLSSGVPATEVAAGTPEVTATGGGISTVSAIALRQYSSSQNIIVDGIRVSSTWDFAPSSTPAISVSPSSLTGFNYAVGNGPSDVQSYSLSGSNLTPASGNITVAGSTNYEVSSDSSTFSGTLDIAYTGGTLSDTTIYVRLKAGLGEGAYNNESISNAGGGATTQNVVASGDVVVKSFFPIDSLKVNDADGISTKLNDTVTTAGIVTSITQLGTGTSGPGTIQNENTAISIYGSTFTNTSGLQIGDSVVVSDWKVAQYNGLTELSYTSTSSVTIISSGHTVDPMVVTIADIKNQTWNGFEKYEGMFVRFNNVRFITTGTFAVGTGSGFNAQFTDGTDTLDFRVVKTNTSLKEKDIPTGIVDLIGFVQQYDGSTPYDAGYQIMPLDSTGIVEYPITPIDSLKQNDSDGISKMLNDTVNTAGIVTSISQVGTGTSGPGTIQNENTAISIYGSSFTGTPGLQIGDSVVVYNWKVSQYNGLTELAYTANAGAQIISTGHIVNLTVVTIPQIKGQAWNGFEQYEGMLLQLNNVEFVQTGTFDVGTSSGVNYQIFNGSDTLDLRITKTNSSILNKTIPTGAVNVIGVLQQYQSSTPYDGGYQIMPLDSSGIITVTAVENSQNTVHTFRLYQNYPNPFNPSTIIRFEVPKSEKVTLKVYDILGREVKILYNDVAPQGITEVNFDASNLATGVYVYTIKTADAMISKKLMLLK